MKDNEVYVLCYNSLQKWSDKKKAMDFYRTGMACSDGSEKERYAEVYCQLNEGYDCVDDGYSDSVLRKNFSIKARKELLKISKAFKVSKEEILNAKLEGKIKMEN